MLRKSRLIAAAAAVTAVLVIAGVHAELSLYGSWLPHERWRTGSHDVMAASGLAWGGDVRPSSFGSPAASSLVDREIVIRPGTHYVNVTNGETVLFRVGNRSFAWKFDTTNHPNFDLSRIAPKDIDVRGARVFCGPTLYERAG